MSADTDRSGPFGRGEEVLLLTPGPTPIHSRASAALHWPMRSHLDPDVLAYNDEIVTSLHALYGSGPGAFAALLSGTGSLAMEAGFMNLVEPGDPVLVVSNGIFGERMIDMATRVGARVQAVRFPLGSPIDLDAVRSAAVRQRPRLIAAVHGETSSGVINPVPALAEVAREVGALFAVDAVTTVGMLPFEMAAWGIDYAYTGSQKCLSAPPGVAPVVFSAAAMERIEARRAPVASWYSDALGMREYWEPNGKRRYHHTVPVQLHWATGEAIEVALEEGMPARHARAESLGRVALAALSEYGFSALVAPEDRLPTVLTLRLPAGLDGAGVRRELRERFGISIAGGLGELGGRIWRLGLMGENARPEHYLRLMRALAELLGEPALPERFEENLAPAA